MSRTHLLHSDAGGRSIIETPRWLFLGTLVYAPLAYGCTRPWAVSILNVLLALCVGLWLGGCLIRRLRPMLPRLLVRLVLALLILGWWMAANAKFEHDPIQRIFVAKQPLVSWLPGSVDGAASQEMMQRITALLLTLLFVCDLAHRPQWRARLWITMVCTGAVSAAIGLLHRDTGIAGGLWQTPQLELATFRDHANAGAFLNLTCALAIGATLRAYQFQTRSKARAFWPSVLLVFVLAGLASDSTAAQGILVLILIAGGCQWYVQSRKLAWQMGAKVYRAGVAAAVAAVILIVAAMHFGAEPPPQLESSGKAEGAGLHSRVYRIGFAMVRDAGFCGFGPGTFPPVFSHYASGLRAPIPTVWEDAHQDYLQCAIEYGLAGAALWFALFAEGFVRAVRVPVSHPLPQSAEYAELDQFPFALVLGLASLSLHALVDFPLQIAAIQLYAVTMLGCAWSPESLKSAAESEREL